MEDQQGPTKFIDPRLQEVQGTTTNLYNKAIEEFGFEMPLAFALYNQIRYYEDFGKLKIGYSIQGKEALANQFGVTVKQIEKAYDNLTNKYKLGGWIISDSPIFRNVKKVWVSNVRQQRMSLEDTLKLIENSYSVGVNDQKLLQRRSKTPTVEELPTEVPPLSESNIKVNNKVIQNNSVVPDVTPSLLSKEDLGRDKSLPHSFFDEREGGPASAGGTVGSPNYKDIITRVSNILGITKFSWSAAVKACKECVANGFTEDDIVKAALGMKETDKKYWSIYSVFTKTEYWMTQVKQEGPKGTW